MKKITKKQEEYTYRLPNHSPKITTKTSLLYTREWLLAAKELGIPIPNRKVCNRGCHSLGEILESIYYGKQLNERIKNYESENKTNIDNIKKLRKISRKK